MNRKPKSREELAEGFQEVLIDKGPAVIDAMVKTLIEKINKGDMKALQLAAEMYGLTKQAPLVSVTQNNVSQVAVEGVGGSRFEKIIKNIEDNERALKGASPTVGQRVLEVEPIPEPISTPGIATPRIDWLSVED